MLFKYPRSFATAFYIAINQLSREQLVKRMGLGGLDSIKPAVFLNILRIIAIARNLNEWRDWPIDSVFPKLIHFDAIRRLAIPTDHLKIEEALSLSSQQYLDSVSQGQKTPHYYKTAKNHLKIMTTAQGPRVPQPMGKPIFTAHQQPIPPQVPQSVGHNPSYEFNSQPIQTSQVPKTIPTSLNATAIPNLNTIPQSGVRQNLQPNTIAQSYVTQTLPQSLPTHHNHSVHNIPENTTLPMLNPWQRQSMFDRKFFFHKIII